MAASHRYSFGPLERRGLLLGLGPLQLSTIAAGLLLAVTARAGLAGTAGLIAALVVLLASLVGALWTREGRPLVARGGIAAAWLLRNRAGPAFDPAPTTGTATGVRKGRVDGRAAPGPRRMVPGMAVLEDPGLPGEEPLGVIRDSRSGTWAAVLAVRGTPLALLDPPDQSRCLEGWRQVLGSLCRPGSPVVRVQWVQRTWNGSEAEVSDGRGWDAGPEVMPGRSVRRAVPEWGGGSVSSPSDSYRQAWAEVAPRITYHDTWLVVAVGSAGERFAHQPGRRRGDEVLAGLRREMRILGAQLTAVDLRPGPPLHGDELADLIRRPHEEAARRRRVARPWPTAVEDRWSCCRADGMWHATFWVAEWPRVEVGPDFLGPLLLGEGRRSVSLIMAPVGSERAEREVRSARTADAADRELRARAGFLASARRQREADGVERREQELAEGHHDFRFSGYVTVSGPDTETLAAACAEVEHAAQSCRLELRRLYGRQLEALTWTLPLGRGLR